MPTCRVPTIFGVVALGLLAHPSAAEDSLRPTFAWPDGLSGRLTVTQSHVREQGNDPVAEWEAHGTARFSVSRAGDDLVIAFEDAAFDLVTNTATGLNGQLAEIFAPLSMALPDYRVGGDGRFVGLEQPAEFLRSVWTAIEPTLETIPPEQLDAVSPTIKQAASRAEYERTIEDRWRDLAGRWAGREVGTGTPTAESESMNLPLSGGSQVPAQVSYRLAGRVPCGPSGQEGCVELELRRVSGGPAARAAYTLILQRDGSRLRVGEFRYEHTLRLIADPETLVPHRTREEWISVIELDSGLETIPIHQSGSRTVAYDYD